VCECLLELGFAVHLDKGERDPFGPKRLANQLAIGRIVFEVNYPRLALGSVSIAHPVRVPHLLDPQPARPLKAPDACRAAARLGPPRRDRGS